MNNVVGLTNKKFLVEKNLELKIGPDHSCWTTRSWMVDLPNLTGWSICRKDCYLIERRKNSQG